MRVEFTPVRTRETGYRPSGDWRAIVFAWDGECYMIHDILEMASLRELIDTVFVSFDIVEVFNNELREWDSGDSLSAKEVAECLFAHELR